MPGTRPRAFQVATRSPACSSQRAPGEAVGGSGGEVAAAGGDGDGGGELLAAPSLSSSGCGAAAGSEHWLTGRPKGPVTTNRAAAEAAEAVTGASLDGPVQREKLSANTGCTRHCLRVSLSPRPARARAELLHKLLLPLPRELL